MEHNHTNALIHESSPYLLQHAHNPVAWQPWSTAARQEAREQNKLMIVSIGYSSCHWCHVMEHESFEDDTVAAVMNESYIPIKIDREERPDVDSIYMNAVQLMTGQGGWPLNIVTLPDGRPVWGGTYFPKQNWIDALQQIAKIYQDDPEKLETYAEKLAGGIQGMNLLKPAEGPLEFDKKDIAENMDTWSRSFDTIEGGMRRAPKFMMPNNYLFLLRYVQQERDFELANFLHTTLKQMAFGGIYDQIGGGFSRYSTDKKWHVPHFEKMLYDNGQLLSLYSKAYLTRPRTLYKDTVYGTIAFLERELQDKNGGFFSALDADSLNKSGKLEEGAYYVWSKDELEELLGTDFELFAAYYNINSYGLWEPDKYVLIRQDTDADFVEEHQLNAKEFTETKSRWNTLLLDHRNQRPAPRLDDKILTGWNALTITGLTDAYKSFGEEKFLNLACDTAQFIIEKQLQPDGTLYRSHKQGKSTINAYLEDYAACIEAFISLYEANAEKKWLDHAQSLTEYTIDHFSSEDHTMFYFTSQLEEQLITKNIEYQDNVIPASNSIMAKNLFKLGHLLSKDSYIERAGRMLLTINDKISDYPAGYSNWLDLKLNLTKPFHEIVITGKQAKEQLGNFHKYYIPNAVFASTQDPEPYLDLFKARWDENDTFIYICTNKTCSLPVKELPEALSMLNN